MTCSARSFRPSSHRRTAHAAAALLAACLGACSNIPGPAPEVTRAEAIAIASVYCQVKWTPTQDNILHGRDPDGIRVHTPDKKLASHGHDHGWWEPGKTMTGMPYQWGGFDTPNQFLQALAQGKAAGDIATAEKRRLDDAATSRHACGIDCSGFVSRCWRLQRHYSTDELTQLCTRIHAWDEIQAGDIFLKNGHVMLFRSWDPRQRGHVLAYEAAPFPKWRVNLISMPIADIEKSNYIPWRYRNIRD